MHLCVQFVQNYAYFVKFINIKNVFRSGRGRGRPIKYLILCNSFNSVHKIKINYPFGVLFEGFVRFWGFKDIASFNNFAQSVRHRSMLQCNLN